ncbi:hypothetical protein [Nocardiopsis sp. NPDC058789]
MTEFGRTLLPALNALGAWGEENLERLQAGRPQD